MAIERYVMPQNGGTIPPHEVSFSRQDMNKILLIATILLLNISTASAQCYGDSAQFGCGISSSSEGTLQRFGDTGNQLVPVYGDARPYSAENLFTQQQIEGYYRQAYRPNRDQFWRSNQASTRAYIRAMDSAAIPVRKFGNIPFSNRPRF